MSAVASLALPLLAPPLIRTRPFVRTAVAAWKRPPAERFALADAPPPHVGEQLHWTAVHAPVAGSNSSAVSRALLAEVSVLPPATRILPFCRSAEAGLLRADPIGPVRAVPRNVGTVSCAVAVVPAAFSTSSVYVEVTLCGCDTVGVIGSGAPPLMV